MIRTAEGMISEKRENMRGGDGTVTLTPAFQPGDYAAGLRLFSRITLPAGASIGYHVHEGEEDLFYFLAGAAEFNDNGETRVVHAGDATVTGSGQGHAVRNCGKDPVEILAIIARL